MHTVLATGTCSLEERNVAGMSPNSEIKQSTYFLYSTIGKSQCCWPFCKAPLEKDSAKGLHKRYKQPGAMQPTYTYTVRNVKVYNQICININYIKKCISLWLYSSTLFKWFSIKSCKTKTKSHTRQKQCNEPTRTISKYM